MSAPPSPTGAPGSGVDPPPLPPPAGLGARMLARPIIAYRRWISPVLPARCRFYPSCSAYALEAVTYHGAVRGTALAVRRLLRCHPFHPGGYDPVPTQPRPRRKPRAPRTDVDVTGATQ
jgi:hypothetical protein